MNDAAEYYLYITLKYYFNTIENIILENTNTLKYYSNTLKYYTNILKYYTNILLEYYINFP